MNSSKKPTNDKQAKISRLIRSIGSKDLTFLYSNPESSEEKILKSAIVYLAQIIVSPDTNEKGIQFIKDEIERLPNEKKQLLNQILSYAVCDIGCKELSENKITEVMMTFTKGIKFNSNYEFFYYYRGIANQQQRKYYEAISDFEMSNKIKENDLTYFELSKIYLVWGNAKSIENLEKAIKLRPHNPVYYHMLGLAYQKLGYNTMHYNRLICLNLVKAIELSDSIYNANSLKQMYTTLVHAIYFTKLDAESTLHIRKQIERLSNEKKLPLLNQLTQLGFRMFEIHISNVATDDRDVLIGACTLLTKIIILTPDIWWMYRERGNINYSLNDDKDALLDYIKALSLILFKEMKGSLILKGESIFKYSIQEMILYINDLNYCTHSEHNDISTHNGSEDKENIYLSYFSRGLAYLLINNYTKSMVDFDKALELGSINTSEDLSGQLHFYRGCIYAQLSQPAKAIVEFDKSIVSEPNAFVYHERANAYHKLANIGLLDFNKRSAVSDYVHAIIEFNKINDYSSAETVFKSLMSLYVTFATQNLLNFANNELTKLPLEMQERLLNAHVTFPSSISNTATAPSSNTGSLFAYNPSPQTNQNVTSIPTKKLG